MEYGKWNKEAPTEEGVFHFRAVEGWTDLVAVTTDDDEDGQLVVLRFGQEGGTPLSEWEAGEWMPVELPTEGIK